MRSVALLLPPVPYSGPATQAARLAPLLRTHGIELRSHFLDSSQWRNLLLPWRRLGDIIHLVGLRSLRRYGVAGGAWRASPIVLSLHGHEHFTWFDRLLLKRVARIVVSYPAAVEQLSRQGVLASRIAVIPPAIASVTPRPGDVRQELGLPADAIVLMASGSMHRPHELTNAIWAYEIMRYTSERYHLLIVGDGPERPNVEDFADSLAPEGTRVRVLGQQMDAPAWFAQADVMLVTPSSGGLTTALEAMAAGTVVVAHDTPQLASVIRHGHNGLLIPAWDHPAAAKALRRVVEDVSLRDALRCNARPSVAEYSCDRATTAWHALYSSL